MFTNTKREVENMRIVKCDICGKEIKSDSPIVDFWKKDLFPDINDNPIEDVCEECYKMIYCCINMMKETEWRPDFHEVLEAEYRISTLEEVTGLEIF